MFGGGQACRASQPAHGDQLRGAGACSPPAQCLLRPGPGGPEGGGLPGEPEGLRREPGGEWAQLAGEEGGARALEWTEQGTAGPGRLSAASTPGLLRGRPAGRGVGGSSV